MVIILGVIAFLAVSGVRANKSYYVTIQELNGMGSKAYTRNLRVAGNVLPGSIRHNGTNAEFVLVENSNQLRVSYQGEEPPPDTFKDNRRRWRSAHTDAMASSMRRSCRRSARQSMLPRRAQSPERRRLRARRLQWLPPLCGQH